LLVGLFFTWNVNLFFLSQYHATLDVASGAVFSPFKCMHFATKWEKIGILHDLGAEAGRGPGSGA